MSNIRFKITICVALLLTLCMGAGVFFANNVAYADTNEYTVTFKNGEQVVDTITIAEGGVITEGDLPTSLTHPTLLPELPSNKYYKWYYSTNDINYFGLNLTGDSTKEILTNVNSDVIFRIRIITKASNLHDVTFNLPNGAKVTTKVAHGENADEPIVDLGFCEKVKYDKSLLAIREDTTINVTIDYTYKYIFIFGCLGILIVSLVVIVVIVFRVLRVPDDEDEEFSEELTENSIKE